MNHAEVHKLANRINEICRASASKDEAKQRVIDETGYTNVDLFLPHMTEFMNLPEGGRNG